MPLALRQLSALYLTAASAYTVAIVLSHHPALADRAGEASAFVRSQGAAATVAVEDYALKPGWNLVRNEASSLAHKVMAAIDAPGPQKRVAILPEEPKIARKLAANLPAHPQLSVKPKAESVPPPGDAQFVPPPPPNTSPPNDESGLRASENDVASAARSAEAPVAPSAQQQASVQNQQARPQATPQQQRLANAVPRPRMQLAPQTEADSLPPDNATPGNASAVPNLPPPTTTEIAQVQQRLKDNLTSEMYENFGLFLYVSKAANGPWAQRMFVFEKQPTGDLALAYNWAVSTGRERAEYNAHGQLLPSYTPSGYYELDPHRFFTHYWSSQWGEPMPYAMFFNWKKDGQDTGLAIHSAAGDDVSVLGNRASAGCIRLPPEAAKTLFNLIRTKYKGLAPQFAVDRRTGTMSNDGIIVHDADGHVQLADGYRVLVFIEDYGGENVVAAMY